MPVTPETRAMVLLAAEICEEKKATDTRILELDPVDAGFTDFFLVTSCTNTRQTGAVADEIELRMKRQFGTYAKSVEGRRTGEWILLDYIDFVVHIFTEETREFYDIERLRKSARTMGAAQMEAELQAALRQKTEAVRKKAPKTLGDVALATTGAAERVPAKKTQKNSAKKAAKKATAKPQELVKAATPEPPAKKAAKKALAKAAKKSAAKKAVKKSPLEHAEQDGGPTKKAAKKSAAKKAAKKAPAKKSTGLVEKGAATGTGAGGKQPSGPKGSKVQDRSRKALPAGSTAKSTKQLPAPKK